MPTSYKAINKYAKTNYDRIAVVVPKGSAEAIKAAAASENKSTNRYILEAIEAKSGLRWTARAALPQLRAGTVKAARTARKSRQNVRSSPRRMI